MKKLLLSIAAVGAAGVGAFFYLNQEPTPVVQETPSDSNEALSAELPESTETCNDQQMFTVPTDEVDWTSIAFSMATSEDGINFDVVDNAFLVGGGVPSITSNEDGTVVTVFNWFPDFEEDPVCYNKIALKISHDNGKTWSEPQGIFVENFPEEYQLPYDPTITTTEDGQYRLFFTTHILGMDEPFVYGSALSPDGIHYTYEEGIRFSSEDHDIVDGSEIQAGDQWYMIAPMAKQNGEALDAVSSDGKTFTERSSNRGDGIYWVGNMTKVNGTVRFYGSCVNSKKGMGKMCYSSTTDGKVWSDPVVTNMPGSDPGITYTAEDQYILIYSEPRTDLPMPENPDSNKR